MPFPRALPRRHPAWLWPLALLLLFLSISPGRVIAFDVALRAQVAHALWSHGTPFVDAAGATGGMVNVPDKGHTSFYGIGQSLVFIPFDWLGTQLAKLGGAHWSQIPIVWLYTPLVGLAWWWMIVLCLREWGVSPGASRRFATLFLCATIVVVYAATTAQEEAIAGALVAGSFVSMMRWCRDGRDRDGALVGMLFAAALLFRLNAIFAALPIAGYAIDARPSVPRAIRGVVVAALGALPMCAVFALFSHWRYGEWIATGYDLAIHQGLGVQWTSVRPHLAFSLLYGLGKGALLLSPPSFLAAIGLAKLTPRRPRFAIGTALAFGLAALLCSRIVFNPDGSECWSVRYLAHLFGFLVYPTWLVAKNFRRTARVLFTLGIALQLVTLFAPDTLEYQQSARLGLHPYTLIDGGTTGQLGLRLRNIGSFLLHRQVAPPNSPEIETLQSNYVPNLWGPAYARKLGGQGLLAGLMWVLWLIGALSAVSLLGVLYHPRRRINDSAARGGTKQDFAKAS